MRKVLEFIMCSRNEDLPRFLAFFDKKIKDGELPTYPAYKKTRGKVEMMPDEKAEAKAEKNKIKAKKEKEPKGGSMEDLEKMILAKRSNQYSNFMSHLESKYCNEEEELGEEDEEGWADMKDKKRKRKPQNAPP
jgi:hypothetical protein